MKQKLSVLACVCAVLVWSGFAMAQNTVTVESNANAPRCANLQVGIDLTNSDQIGAVGLGLVVRTISGGAFGTVTGASVTGRTAGCLTVVNLAGVDGSDPDNLYLGLQGCCIAAGSGDIWTLDISTGTACDGTFEIDSATVAPCGGFELVDCSACPTSGDFVKGLITLINNAPVCGVNNPINQHFSFPINRQLNASDADACDNLTYALVSGGSGDIDISASGQLTWNPTCADATPSPKLHTITFSVTDDCNASENCTIDIELYHNPPTCTDPADVVTHWTDPVVVQLVGSDDGCVLDPPVWSVISVVPPLTNAPTINGDELTINPDCADIGNSPHTVTVQIDDGEFQDQCEFDVTVTNTAPVISCSDIVDSIIYGELVETVVGGTDGDGDPLCFDILCFENQTFPGQQPVNQPTIDCDGNFSWQTCRDEVWDEGVWKVCVEVSDGCFTDTCEFLIDRVYLKWFLSLTPDAVCDLPCDDIITSGPCDSVLNGHTTKMYVQLHDGGIALGGFDLRLMYDITGLTLLGAEPACNVENWEYFTYRTDDCNSSGCPSGTVHLIGIADLHNGVAHPDDADFFLEGAIACLEFYVTDDREFIGQCLYIDWLTLDCGDNVLSSKGGDTLFTDWNIPVECSEDPKHDIRPILCYDRGCICIIPPPDDRGDLNLNGIANEVGDYVLYSNYFIYGDVVWDPTFADAQILASDINNDGIVLTVGDLVYLMKIITGDADPFPESGEGGRITPFADNAIATYEVRSDAVTLTATSTVNLGAAQFVINHTGVELGQPTLAEGVENMSLKYNDANGVLRILVHSLEGEIVESGQNSLVNIPVKGNGSVEMIEANMSDDQGALLTVESVQRVLPTTYALHQNYPNPFNAGTVITFDLVDATDYTLNIYNVTGQLVKSINGFSEPGTVSVAWDATGNNGEVLSSGVYFYRLVAGQFNMTKKMMIVK